jgi:hypothetical protein
MDLVDAQNYLEDMSNQLEEKEAIILNLNQEILRQETRKRTSFD